MDLIKNIFEVINATLIEFFDTLDSGIGSIVSLFYKTGTAENPGSFTFLGTMLMIGLGIGLVWTLIKWISGLVRNVAR